MGALLYCGTPRSLNLVDFCNWDCVGSGSFTNPLECWDKLLDPTMANLNANMCLLWCILFHVNLSSLGGSDTWLGSVQVKLLVIYGALLAGSMMLSIAKRAKHTPAARDNEVPLTSMQPHAFNYLSAFSDAVLRVCQLKHTAKGAADPDDLVLSCLSLNSKYFHNL